MKKAAVSALAMLILLSCLCGCSPAVNQAESSITQQESREASFVTPSDQSSESDEIASPQGMISSPAWEESSIEKAIRISIEQPDSFAPWKTSSADIADMLSLIYEPLWTQKEDGHLNLLLADNVQPDPEGGFVDIHLSEGITFHDGSVLDAADVSHSVQMLKSGQNVYAKAVEGISETLVVDYYTIRFYTDEALYPAMFDWIFPVFPEELTDASDPVGTGPYAWTSQSKRRAFTLQAYENYHGPAPKLSEVKVTVLTGDAQSSSPVFRAFLSGMTNLVRLEDADPGPFLYQPDYTICSWTGDEAVYLEFASSGPGSVFSNRQKICQSIDADRVLRDACYGFGEKTHLPIRPGVFYSPAAEPDWQDAYPFDPEYAMEIDMAGTVSTIRVRYDAGDAVSRRAAESVRSQLEKTEIPVSLVTYGGWDVYLHRGEMNLQNAADLCGCEEALLFSGTEEELTDACRQISGRFMESLDYRVLFYVKEGIVLGPGLNGSAFGSAHMPYLGAHALN